MAAMGSMPKSCCVALMWGKQSYIDIGGSACMQKLCLERMSFSCGGQTRKRMEKKLCLEAPVETQDWPSEAVQ